MQNIFEIRRRNILLLQKITEKVFSKNNKKSKRYTDAMFSKHIALSSAYFSQLKKEASSKRLSESSARKIEALTNLPVYWLDKDHENADYQDILLKGTLIKKLLLLYDQFMKLDGINFTASESIEKKKSGMIEDVILKANKCQDISLDDLVTLYINN